MHQYLGLIHQVYLCILDTKNVKICLYVLQEIYLCILDHICTLDAGLGCKEKVVRKKMIVGVFDNADNSDDR